MPETINRHLIEREMAGAYQHVSNRHYRVVLPLDFGPKEWHDDEDWDALNSIPDRMEQRLNNEIAPWASWTVRYDVDTDQGLVVTGPRVFRRQADGAWVRLKRLPYRVRNVLRAAEAHLSGVEDYWTPDHF